MSRSGRFDEVEAEEPYPGVRRRTVQAEQATVAEYAFEPGASFPLHSHPQEQVTLVLDGDVELTADGRAERLTTGAWSVVPGGVAHGVRAGADGARIVAVVVPRRETQP
jgi:quercetin dioxygenase-like cupin family protein